MTLDLEEPTSSRLQTWRSPPQVPPHTHTLSALVLQDAVTTLVFLLTGSPRSEVQEEVECAPSPHLSLTLKVAGLGTTREVELPLSNYKSTIFFYVQRLLQLSCSGAVKTDKLRRIWEPTYT